MSVIEGETDFRELSRDVRVGPEGDLGPRRRCVVDRLYTPNSASAVSTRASIGVWPNGVSMRFAFVRC
jgi:hypothetical protein